MIFAYPYIGTVNIVESGVINSIVIENKRLFLDVVNDIYNQVSGNHGKAIISSENGKIEDFSKNAVLLSSFVPFDISNKHIVSKIVIFMEKRSYESVYLLQSKEILSKIEEYFDSLLVDYQIELSYSKLSVSSLLKSAGIEIIDDCVTLSEKILKFMELITEFDGEMLFIMINYRSFVDDNEAEMFMKTAISYKYNLLLMDSSSFDVLTHEKRITIDNDLCIF